MRLLLQSAQILLLDLASTFGFLVIVLLTHNVTLAVALGMAMGASQIIWHLARSQRVDAMQWLSVFIVVASGGATLLTADPRFVMVKPSLLYLIAGIVMLRPGWMIRHMPPVGRELVPDLGMVFGFVWSALMFASALINVYVAMNYSLVAWSAFMSIFAIASKVMLFLIAFVTLRTIGRQRWRARLAQAVGQAGLAGN
jgi:intracellular septation protein A